MEAAGHLVAVAAELAAAAELGEGDLDAGHLELGVDVGRDAAAVVDDPAAAVGQQGDVDAVAVAGHGLVDGVVDDLPDEVVEAGDAGAADVHARPLPDVRQPLEDRHGRGGVGLGLLRHGAAFQRLRGTGVLRPFGPLPRGRMQRVNEAQHDGAQDTSRG